MRLALDGAGVAAPDDGEGLDVRAREVRERLGLEVAPHVLDGIEFGRVGGEVEGAGPAARQEVADGSRAMRVGAIPHQRHRRAQMPVELFAESQHRRRIEVLLDERLKVQADDAAAGTDTERGDHRDFAAVATDVPQHRGLATWPPRAAHHGQQE